MPPFNHKSPFGLLIHLAYLLAIVAQVVLIFTIEPHWYIPWLHVPGYILWVAAAPLGMLPVIIFRRGGGVKKGKSYVETHKLVTSGLYSLVRHPQFLSLIYIGLAVALLVPHWITITLGVLIGVASYAAMLSSDRQLVKKFGADEEYKEYMARVPRANLPWGILKRLFLR